MLPGVHEWHVSFFRPKKWNVVVLHFCWFIINHSVCRKRTTLQIGNTHEYTVRRQICCLSRASSVIVVVSGPSMVSVVFRPVRSWCSAAVAFGCVCLSHVYGWLTSVEVFAAVPLVVSCFQSCRVRGYFVVRWNVGAQAGCFIAVFGHKRRHVMRARLVFWRSGASGMGANAVDKKSTFWGVFKTSDPP